MRFVKRWSSPDRATRDISSDLRGAPITPRVTQRAAITEPQELGALLRAMVEARSDWIVSGQAMKGKQAVALAFEP
jgi:hypothetical protein